MSESSAANLVTNVFLPFSSGKLIQGSVEYVAVEVLVSWMIRYVMSMPRDLIELSSIHLFSLPLLGGAVGFMDPAAGYEAEIKDQITGGAKGIPAVLLAHYIVQVFEKGFTRPNGAIKEYLVTMVAKMLSKPLTSMVIGYLPDNVSDALQVLHAMVVAQTKASNFSK